MDVGYYVLEVPDLLTYLEGCRSAHTNTAGFRRLGIDKKPIMFKSVVGVDLQWTEGKRTVCWDLNLSPVCIGVVVFRFSASTCFNYVCFYLFIYFFYLLLQHVFTDIGKIINI